MKKKKVNKRKIDPKVLAITGIIKEEILDLKNTWPIISRKIMKI